MRVSNLNVNLTDLLFPGQKANYISISFETEISLFGKELMFSILEIVQYLLLTSFLAKTSNSWIGDKVVKFFGCTLNFLLRTLTASSLERTLPKTALTIIWFVFNGHEFRSFLLANAFGAWLQLGDSSLALESFKISKPLLELRSSCSLLLLEATDLLSEFVSLSDSSGSISSWSLVSI